MKTKNMLLTINDIIVHLIKLHKQIKRSLKLNQHLIKNVTTSTMVIQQIDQKMTIKTLLKLYMMKINMKTLILVVIVM